MLYVKSSKTQGGQSIRTYLFLILTSVREEASRRRYELETGLELAVDDYVEKPVSPDTLLQRVGKLIKRKQKV